MSTALLSEALAGQQARAAGLLRGMYQRLVEAYGPQGWWPADTPMETVVGAYLTQNTSWRNVERSIANLKAAGVLTFEGLRDVPLERLRELIRPSGYMVRKALAIKAFVALLDERYGGSLAALGGAPDAREVLLALPGVGPETADALVLYALGRPAMVADEYLRRVVVRHGLLAPGSARYAALQRLAAESLAEETDVVRHFNEFHALMVQVGKTHCRGVARCEGCPLYEARWHPPSSPEERAR